MKEKMTDLLANKRNLLLVLAGVVLLGGTAAYALSGGFSDEPNRSESESFINNDEPDQEQIDAGSDAKQDTIEQNEPNGPKSSNGSETPPAPVPQEGSDKKVVGISITAKSHNGDVVQIRSLIGTVTSEGTCTLTLSKNGQVVTKTTDVQALPTTSTCRGFDIPSSELSVGTWQLALTYESPTLTGATSSTVEVKQ